MALTYDPRTATLTARLGFSLYEEGDYAQLHSNNGSGAVDWTNAHDGRRIENIHDATLWTSYGWGHGTWGHFPWGAGQIEFDILCRVAVVGLWIWGLGTYDKLGNQHTGVPAEISYYVCLTPEVPSALKGTAYNAVTNTLTLEV